MDKYQYLMELEALTSQIHLLLTITAILIVMIVCVGFWAVWLHACNEQLSGKIKVQRRQLQELQNAKS